MTVNPPVTRLPPSTSPSLRLCHATPAERTLGWTLNSVHWRGDFPLPVFLRRQEHLGNQAFTRDGGITHWVLVEDESSPSASPRRILASCETFRERGLVAREGGQVEDVTAHGIGSVFCREEFRGRGYAGRMMEELARKLAAWSQPGWPRTQFTVLYSDLGKKFYASKGWHPYPSASISLPSSPSPPAQRALAEPLSAASLAPLCRTDESLLRTRLAQLSQHSPATIYAAIAPDISCMQWHHAREEFAARHGLGREPTIKGAIAGSKEGSRVWAIWARTFGWERKGGTLFVLRLVVEGDGPWDQAPGRDKRGKERRERVVEVLRAAQLEAGQWGVETVEIWNPSDLVVEAARSLVDGAQVVHREMDDIASLMWYGKEETASVEWVANERYAWC